jgi:hypothetical protein
MKKILLIFIILTVIGAIIFYWWNNQSDIRDLNEGLPEGIRIEKSLFGFGKDYKIVNKIDRYEFKMPREWTIIEEIEYFPKNIEENYMVSSIYIDGNEGIINIAQFDIDNANINLLSWVENYFNASEVKNNFEEGEVNKFKIVKTLEFDLGLMGNMYFLKKGNVIYGISSPSENLIKEVISNGSW